MAEGFLCLFSGFLLQQNLIWQNPADSTSQAAPSPD